jgi:hypothetical protein
MPSNGRPLEEEEFRTLHQLLQIQIDCLEVNTDTDVTLRRVSNFLVLRVFENGAEGNIWNEEV